MKHVIVTHLDDIQKAMMPKVIQIYIPYFPRFLFYAFRMKYI